MLQSMRWSQNTNSQIATIIQALEYTLCKFPIQCKNLHAYVYKTYEMQATIHETVTMWSEHRNCNYYSGAGVQHGVQNSSCNVRRIVTPTCKKPTRCALHMMRWSFKFGHQGITFEWRLTKTTTWFPFTRTADCPLQNHITNHIQFSLPCPVKPLQAIHMNYRNPMRKLT
jgi:hypothetical protein